MPKNFSMHFLKFNKGQIGMKSDYFDHRMLHLKKSGNFNRGGELLLSNYITTS